MQTKEVALLAILFLVAFAVYSIPLRSSAPFNQPLPYGEPDSAYHYALAGAIVSRDHVFGFTESLPSRFGFWHGVNGSTVSSAYPPSYHVGLASVEQFSSETIVAYYTFAMLIAFIIIFPTYLLVRKLYGFLAGAVAGVGLIFANRNLLIFIFGQHPSILSFAFVPAVIYCVYRYADSLVQKNEASIYAYLAALLLACQFIIHVQAFFTSVLFIIAFGLMIMIKERPLVNAKTLVLCFIVFAVLAIPILPSYSSAAGGHFDASQIQLGRLLRWNIMPSEVVGNYPASYVNFSDNFGTWMLPFMLVTIIFLALRRERADLAIIAWIIAVYASIHLDLLGYTNYEIRTTARMLLSESALFFSLVGISIVAIPGIFKVPAGVKALLKYGLSAAVIALIAFFSAGAAINSASTAYPGVSRINPYQLEAANWMRANLPQDALVYDIGTITYSKVRWMLALSGREVAQAIDEITNAQVMPTHVIIDSSDATLISRQDMLSQLNSVNVTGVKVYDKGYIRIYQAR